jgi:hypothetical protein
MHFIASFVLAPPAVQDLAKTSRPLLKSSGSSSDWLPENRSLLIVSTIVKVEMQGRGVVSQEAEPDSEPDCIDKSSGFL